MSNKTAIVKTIGTSGDFPWSQGVKVNLLCEDDDMLGLEKCIADVKGMINTDAQKHGIPFKSLDIRFTICK